MIFIKLKGIDKFLAKIPAFSGKKIVILPLYAASVVSLTIIILNIFALLPTIILSTEIIYVITLWFPVIGVIIMEIVGLLLVLQMWSRRDKLKLKYGVLSYQKIFLAGFGGVAILLTLAIYNLISLPLWQTPFWFNFPFQIFTIQLTSLLGFLSYPIQIICFALLIYFIVTSLIQFVRALQIFGIDYMVVLYLYFPEESELQDHKIYSLLRHPAYSGIIKLSLAGVLFQQNLYSILFFIIYLLGFYIHIHFVEEKELIQRFGESYINYRKETPAFFVKPKNFIRFLKFIFFGKI